jgi:CRISPR-associated protein Cmr4
MTPGSDKASCMAKPILGMAIDPIHVGTGGARLGHVDQPIVRDPVTRVPKIPGSSLAGVYRAYSAMAEDKYPDCAGQGQANKQGREGHCGKRECAICTVYGFARNAGGGFAGLAAFSDAQLLLFPVATWEGPVWITCPAAMRLIQIQIPELEEAVVYRSKEGSYLNLGWLHLPVKEYSFNDKRGNIPNLKLAFKDLNIPDYIRDHIALVTDKIFSHVVNSNLEVRTSVSINPETGAAEEGALFSYEAIPRSTVLVWEVICKNPKTYQSENSKPNSVNSVVNSVNDVFKIVTAAHPYLEWLGIGGMGTRGMGRLRVLLRKHDETQIAQGQEQTGGA